MNVVPLVLGTTFIFNSAKGQIDTLKVMTYNVLYYGDQPSCQGSHTASHGYLQTIINYTKPDLIGLEKMAAIPMYTGDHSGSAPKGFADSVLDYALNPAVPGTYAYCPYTNNAGADNMDLLYYNKNKVGFASLLTTYSNITDFNTYKMYYKDAALATTHDTLFFYVTLNHDNSGSSSSDIILRGQQIDGEMANLQTHFTRLPNMINMGDFNTHNTSEECYQRLVTPPDTNFRFYDPPFYPDGDLSYPADWDSNPSTYAGYLTTSTRQSSSVPNSCGSSGGGKSWYDHIFLSANLLHCVDRLWYQPHSYKTIGNDGFRVGVSVNDWPTNSSAPSSVINAIFQMSNKYPVLLNLIVAPLGTAVAKVDEVQQEVTIENPIGDEFVINTSKLQAGTPIKLQCTDISGRILDEHEFIATGSQIKYPCNLKPGSYIARLFVRDKLPHCSLVVKL